MTVFNNRTKNLITLLLNRSMLRFFNHANSEQITYFNDKRGFHANQERFYAARNL